jgi:Family of unknown function (DUF6713)
VGDILFFVGASSLLMHEMDAIDKKEWRLMFVLRKLPDEGALRWFVLLHLPLFVGLLALVAAGPSSTTRWIEGSVDVFLIVHAALHESLSRTGDKAFANTFSRWLIWSAALFGAAHLVYLLV